MIKLVTLRLDVDKTLDNETLLNYVLNSVNDYRGCYRPGDTEHDFKCLSASTARLNMEIVKPEYGFGRGMDSEHPWEGGE